MPRRANPSPTLDTKAAPLPLWEGRGEGAPPPTPYRPIAARNHPNPASVPAFGPYSALTQPE